MTRGARRAGLHPGELGPVGPRSPQERPLRPPRRFRALVLAPGLLLAAGCDAPAVPVVPGPYDFRLQVTLPDGTAQDRVFHWPRGATVPVYIPRSDVAGRPPLRPALARAVELWNRTAVFGEVTLEETDDLSRARAVLAWEDIEPVLSTPVSCVGPTTGAASTRGCLSADVTRLEAWPRRDGGPSRVLFRVEVRPVFGIDEALLARLVAHEIGHVLGILRHSPDLEDLMSGGQFSTDRPTARDRATLRSLYQTPVDMGF